LFILGEIAVFHYFDNFDIALNVQLLLTFNHTDATPPEKSHQTGPFNYSSKTTKIFENIKLLRTTKYGICHSKQLLENCEIYERRGLHF
jgi:hypothetical protein